MVLQANYGKSSEEAVAAVKALYRDLRLEQAFFDYEQASHEQLTATIDEQTLLPKQVPHSPLKVSCVALFRARSKRTMCERETIGRHHISAFDAGGKQATRLTLSCYQPAGICMQLLLTPRGCCSSSLASNGVSWSVGTACAYFNVFPHHMTGDRVLSLFCVQVFTALLAKMYKRKK